MILNLAKLALPRFAVNQMREYGKTMAQSEGSESFHAKYDLSVISIFLSLTP